MTTVYGVTRYGAKAQILRQLKDIPEFPKEHAWNASIYLTDKTFFCLNEMFSATKDIQVKKFIHLFNHSHILVIDMFHFVSSKATRMLLERTVESFFLQIFLISSHVIITKRLST
jgi:DNA-directed RNA polymerase